MAKKKAKKPRRKPALPAIESVLSIPETISSRVERYDRDGNVVEVVDDRELEEERRRLVAAVAGKTWALLAPTDWIVLRQIEVPTKTIPEDVATWRAEVRAASAYLQESLEAARSLEDLDAVDLALLWTIEPGD
jgi:hypothetical protein